MNKCKVLSFEMSESNAHEFQYKLFDHNIEIVHQMKDLFAFKKHLDFAVSRYFKLLSFIKRSTKEFRDISAIFNC